MTDSALTLQFQMMCDRWAVPQWHGLGLSSPLVVAVSGGSDSLALLWLTKCWGDRAGRDILAVTVDHKLRPESAAEALYVAKICSQLGVAHTILNWETPVHSAQKARLGRYRLMSAFAQRHSARCIILGHTYDDQLETAMIRLHQGTHLYGLGGMDVWALSPAGGSDGGEIHLFRPLLFATRDDLQAFLTDRTTDWITDPSNTNVDYLRPQIRRFLHTYPETRHAVKEVLLRAGHFRRAHQAHAASFLGRVEIEDSKLILPRKGLSLLLLKRVAQAVSGKRHNVRHQRAAQLMGRIKSAEIFRTTLHGCMISVRKRQVTFQAEDAGAAPAIVQASMSVAAFQRVCAANAYFT